MPFYSAVRAWGPTDFCHCSPVVTELRGQLLRGRGEALVAAERLVRLDPAIPHAAVDYMPLSHFHVEAATPPVDAKQAVLGGSPTSDGHRRHEVSREHDATFEFPPP